MTWTVAFDVAAAACLLTGALLALVVVLQMTTSVVSSHLIGRASFRAGQVRHDLLVVDELSEVLDHEEPRGAP